MEWLWKSGRKGKVNFARGDGAKMPSGARCLIEISWTGLAFPRSLTSVLIPLLPLHHGTRGEELYDETVEQGQA